MSYSGLNFDIVTGITAIVVAALLATGRAGVRTVRAWNVMGTLLLVNIIVIAAAVGADAVARLSGRPRQRLDHHRAVHLAAYGDGGVRDPRPHRDLPGVGSGTVEENRCDARSRYCCWRLRWSGRSSRNPRRCNSSTPASKTLRHSGTTLTARSSGSIFSTTTNGRRRIALRGTSISCCTLDPARSSHSNSGIWTTSGTASRGRSLVN